MAPKKEVEKKTLYDHIAKYQWLIGVVFAWTLKESDKQTGVTNELNLLKISIAEIKISLNNVIEEIHRSN